MQAGKLWGSSRLTEAIESAGARIGVTTYVVHRSLHLLIGPIDLQHDEDEHAVSVDLHGVFLAFLTFRNHRHLKSHWRRQRLRSPPNPETSIKITAYVQASSFKSTICSVSQTRVDPNIPVIRPTVIPTVPSSGLGSLGCKQKLRTKTDALWGRRDGCKRH